MLSIEAIITILVKKGIAKREEIIDELKKLKLNWLKRLKKWVLKIDTGLHQT